jgi:hypothetical protein
MRFFDKMSPSLNFMAAVLLRMARLDGLDGNAEPQPPNGESARAIRSDNGVPFASPNGLLIVKESVRNAAICVN